MLGGRTVVPDFQVIGLLVRADGSWLYEASATIDNFGLSDENLASLIAVASAIRRLQVDCLPRVDPAKDEFASLGECDRRKQAFLVATRQ